MMKTQEEVAYEVNGQLLTEGQYAEHLNKQRKDTYADMAKMRDEWVLHRAQSGVEDRWRRARALYIGDEAASDDNWLTETLKTGPSPKAGPGTPPRSKVVVNIVRPKVDQAVARMCEILLPVDDRCWGIRPTPIPQAINQMLGDLRQTVIPDTNEPTGMTADEEAKAYVQAAKEAAEAMEKQIDDRLTECGYNGEQRKMIEDGVCLGTGVVFGPIPAKQTSKTWTKNSDGTYAVVREVRKSWKSERADPWDVWFDPSCGNDHQNGSGVWRRKFVTRKQLRALCEVRGYDADAIRQVLLTEPTRVRVAEGRCGRFATALGDKSYELWEYHGEIEPRWAQMATLRTEDPLDVDFGVLLMVNDICIGALESWVPDRTLPCDVWCWRKSDSSPYGYGLPFEMEHQQRVCTSAWRMVMDNGRYALSSQIVYTGGLVPHNGDFTIGPGPKLWRGDPDKIKDVREAFQVFGFDAHLQELLLIAEKAMQFSDQETSMPQLLGGEKGTAPETVGGMVMLYNTANSVLRMRVKLYDDEMTRPHISRYYDVEMCNNPDPKIKGDSEVDARGSTALLEKDIQNQATLNLANITANPRYQPFLDPQKELEVLLKAFKLQPQDVMLSDDKIKANLENPPAAPVDPRIASAEIKAKTDMAKLEDNERTRQLQREQIAYNQAREQGEFELGMTENSINRDMELLRLDQTAQLSREAAAAKERMQALEIDTKRQLFNAEAALKTAMGQGI